MSEHKKKTNNNNRNKTRFLVFLLAALALTILVVLSVLNFISTDITVQILPYGLLLLAVLISALIILLIRFFNSIKLIDQNAKFLSQGKLNISDVLADKTKGLETLTLAFNDMKRNLLSFIEATKSNVIVLSDAVNKMSESLDMTYKGNEQITASMQTVAEKAQNQLSIVKDTLDNIQKVSLRAENITSTLANIEEFVENTTKLTIEGSSRLDKYNEQVDLISANLGDTSNFIEALNNHLQEINQVGDLILNITEQLTLLSLNSAVEAARVGEAGKGFVVVAQEMNKLSSATKNSVGLINTQLNNIMNSSSKVGESIMKVSDSFTISKEIFNSVKTSFHTINNNANILNNDMKKVYEEAMLISQSTTKISEQGSILHDASHEISSITQDVAAVTEEELAENEQLNSQALSLHNMLTSIRSLLRRYKTSAAPVEKVNSKKLRFLMMAAVDHPFWIAVRQGVLYAQNELKDKNAEVEFMGFTAFDDQFIRTLDTMLDEEYDGIVIPGFVANLDKYVEKANRKNIPIIAYNCDLPKGQSRLAYYGPDVKATAITAGELLVKSMEEEGEVVMFTGDQNSVCQIRKNSMLSVMRKSKKIKVVAEIDTIIDNETVYQKTKELLTAYPNLKGLVTIIGGAHGAAKAIQELNRTGKVKLLCYDYDNDIIDYIRKGVISVAMGQDPFGQGHDPLIYLYNYLAAGEKPEDIIHTRIEIMDIRNVN